MFFSKKKNKKKQEQKAAEKSAELRRQALANARKARATIGEETLDEIRRHLEAKENSPLEQARRQIEAMDRDRVTDNIRHMIDDDKK